MNHSLSEWFSLYNQRCRGNPCIVLLWAQCPVYTAPTCFSVHRLRCMLHHLGADHLVEAPVSTIEENGSDSLRMPFLMAPRRPGLPAKSAPLLGPGPQARRTLATFLLWKVARPQAEYPLKRNRGFALRGEFLSERSERNQRIAGGWGFKERPAADALVFQEPHPRTPCFTWEHF